jgi:hypothetical protein
VSSDIVSSDSGPYATAEVCTSGTHWTGGTGHSMRPGNACISCHERGGGPHFSAAGTVYKTAHEPVNCDGAPNIDVVLTGADGVSVTLTTNSAGNFDTRASIALPFTAKLVLGGNERQMATPQMTGDCNECHADPPLNGAPGRVMAP